MTLPASTRTDPALALLRAGVPLTLLIDLSADDPHSEQIYAEERPARVLTPAPRPAS